MSSILGKSKTGLNLPLNQEFIESGELTVCLLSSDISFF